MYSFTKGGPACPIWTWCCHSEHWGLSWQAVGSWHRDEQGPLATSSKKNLTGKEAARPRPRILPWRQTGHTLAVPCPPIRLPQIFAPQGRAAIENQQELTFQPASVSGSCHFYTPWTDAKYSSPQRQTSYVCIQGEQQK